MPPRRKT